MGEYECLTRSGADPDATRAFTRPPRGPEAPGYNLSPACDRTPDAMRRESHVDVPRAEGLADGAASADLGEWARPTDVANWPDPWLLAAVRREPPDMAALDALAERHWKALYARCRLLTVDEQSAGDLAQEAWCRVLRARSTLRPDGNFPAYLSTIATNLWRDWNRSARRAGPLADHRVASLDAVLPTDEGDGVSLGDVLPDLSALPLEDQTLLAFEIDRALDRLSPHLREVLVARFLDGESCAEIGRRHGRTEQTASAWVRQAIREVQATFDLGAPGRVGGSALDAS